MEDKKRTNKKGKIVMRTKKSEIEYRQKSFFALRITNNRTVHNHESHSIYLIDTTNMLEHKPI